jgi:hypothetical protein
MKKSTIITWTLLIVLTIASALVSKINGKYIVFIILLLAVLKFIGITFQFMELKKAHSFWKVSVVVFLLLFTGIIVLIK